MYMIRCMHCGILVYSDRVLEHFEVCPELNPIIVPRPTILESKHFHNPFIDECINALAHNTTILEDTMAMPNHNTKAAEHAAGTTPFYCLLCLGSSYPVTQTFDTESAAWLVADEMARKHDGQRFFVMKSVGSSSVEKPVVRRNLTTKPTTKTK